MFAKYLAKKVKNYLRTIFSIPGLSVELIVLALTFLFLFMLTFALILLLLFFFLFVVAWLLLEYEEFKHGGNNSECPFEQTETKG